MSLNRPLYHDSTTSVPYASGVSQASFPLRIVSPPLAFGIDNPLETCMDHPHHCYRHHHHHQQEFLNNGRAASNKRRISPTAQLAKPEPLILRRATSGLSGLSSLPGRKHYCQEELNEDAGSICEADLDLHDQHYHLCIAWVCDGHGPIGAKDNRPGKVVAQAALTTHQEILSQYLGELVRAPVLSPEKPNYLQSSRQAVFSDILNKTSQKVVQTLPEVTTWAGTTATILFSLGDRNLRGPVSILCSAIGDSTAILLSFRVRRDKSGRKLFIPEQIHPLTTEDNIRRQREKDWVEKECLRHGYRKAAVKQKLMTTKSQLELVMVPSNSSFDISPYEPFSGIPAIQSALSHAKSKLLPSEPYSVYAVQKPYYWKLDAGGSKYSKGLQLTGTIGDVYLEPIKKSTCSPNQVKNIRLLPDQSQTTLLIAASDGLWDAVYKLPTKCHTFSKYIADYLTVMGGRPGVHQGLADDIARWATKRERDDVTVAVLGYPGYTVG